MDEQDVPGVLGRSVTTPMDSADKIFDLRRDDDAGMIE